jgi:hypothetical protein
MRIEQKHQVLPEKIENINLDYLNKFFKNDNLVRFAITSSDDNNVTLDYAICEDTDIPVKNIFEFNKRKYVNNNHFNAVMIVPTGIAAETGGDSGDGNAAARLIGSVVDNLITHPNVVNAADINEMTPNTLYVEGSVLNRFMLGTVGLQKSRGNRIMMIVDPNEKYITDLSVNAASAARVTLGCDIDVFQLDDAPQYDMFAGERGIAVGKVEKLEKVINIIQKYKNDYDSFALHTILFTEKGLDLMKEYFQDMHLVNPWGGIEAMITHTISNLLDVSVAHAPMLTREEIAYGAGIINPRKTPESLSKTELHCILRGMYYTPKIVENIESSNILSNKDIHALVTPDRCISIPILSALEQNIPVIAVEDKLNVMNNDLSKLPWKRGQFYKAKDHIEAAGLLMMLKHGISYDSLKRPIDYTKIITK